MTYLPMTANVILRRSDLLRSFLFYAVKNDALCLALVVISSTPEAYTTCLFPRPMDAWVDKARLA